MGSRKGWFPVALLLLAASALWPPVAAAAAGGGEAEHAVQQHSERISGAPPSSHLNF
jgi:putative beta-1,4-xylosyltransferase IRX10